MNLLPMRVNAVRCEICFERNPKITVVIQVKILPRKQMRIELQGSSMRVKLDSSWNYLARRALVVCSRKNAPWKAVVCATLFVKYCLVVKTCSLEQCRQGG
jgi:hypothetical protein